MTDLRAIAQRIANWNLEDSEFCQVYEDDDAAELSEEDQAEIQRLITNAKAVLPPVSDPET